MNAKAAAAGLALFATAMLSGGAEPPSGQAIFKRFCAECHAPGHGHPGTQQLGWTRGADRAVLEERRDLAPDYVIYVVRHGLIEMPAIRPTEISDADLKVLADYLAKRPKS